MKDRQPTRPGRVKITPENGAAYYAVMEMADEPTEVGTPPTKVNLLKDSTAALLGGSADMVPDEAFLALKHIIDNLGASDVGAAQIEVGSYSGDGASTKTLTFSAQPKFVFLTGFNSSGRQNGFWAIPYGVLMVGNIASTDTATNRSSCVWAENTLAVTDVYAGGINNSGQEYRYAAIL